MRFFRTLCVFWEALKNRRAGIERASTSNPSLQFQQPSNSSFLPTFVFFGNCARTLSVFFFGNCADVLSFSMCFYARTTLSVFFFRKLCGFSFFFDVFLCAFFVHYASFGKIMELSLLFFGATLRVLYLLFILCPRLQHYFFLVFFFLVCL